MYDVIFKIYKKENSQKEVNAVHSALMNSEVKGFSSYFVASLDDSSFIRVGLFINAATKEEATDKAHELMNILGYSIHKYDSVVEKPLYGRPSPIA